MQLFMVGKCKTSLHTWCCDIYEIGNHNGIDLSKTNQIRKEIYYKVTNE